MGNSIEMTGDQMAQGSDGATAPPSVAGREQIPGDSGASQSPGIVEKAKNNAQDRVRSAVSSGKTQAAETVSTLAQSLMVAGAQLQTTQSGTARIVQQAAERLDRIADYLEDTDLDDVVRKTENWARQNPALFVGGAFLVGILGARFLKSSRRSIDEQTGAAGAASSPFSDREVARSPVVEGL